MQVLDTVDAEAIRALHERGEFFWLDLQNPTDAEVDLLGSLLGIPPLAIQDTKEFGQRPKIDDYGQRVLVVFYGAHGGDLVEVHVHVSGDEVVTVRRQPCAHLGAARELAAARTAHSEQELFRLQQIVVPQRDLLGRGGDLLESLPGLERDAARHRFRDVHDDLVLTVNEVEYLRDLLAEAVNVLLNQMAGRLTVVATFFLPLTFATGFFGMNFGWLVDHIDSAAGFFLLGLGSMAVTVLFATLLLLRAGYLGRR